MAVWLVRAGAHGEDEEYALNNEQVVIGWDALPDLSSVGSREELLDLCRIGYPDDKERTLLASRNQVWAFRTRIQIGDIVVLPSKVRSSIAFGHVVGNYEYRPVRPYHYRKVQWINKEIPRASFEQDILYSFGAFLTVCQIKRNNAEQRIKSVLAGTAEEPDPEDEETSDEAAIPNLEEYARDQIQSLIAEKFHGHDLARLVDAVLRAQGYVTRLSPPGPDGGVDITAGSGLLGFDSPRFLVQVKSGGSPVDVRVVRELQGIMNNLGAQHCLFVSWGGYKSSVPSETRSLYFQIRLWDAGDLVKAVLANYDRLPADIRADLPLKRMWVPVQEE